MPLLSAEQRAFLTGLNDFIISEKRKTGSLSHVAIGYRYCQNTRMKGEIGRLAPGGSLKCVPKCIRRYYSFWKIENSRPEKTC